MSKRMFWLQLFAWLFLMNAALAATPGTLEVRVADVDMGLAIPSVSVTLSGASLSEAQERLTDVNGQATFEALPAGAYQLRAAKAGFASLTIDRVMVRDGQLTLQRIAMPIAGTAEAIEVVGSRRAPRPQQTRARETLTQDFLERVPAGRSYQGAAEMASGVTGANPNLAGAAYNENAYVLDGATITDPVTGTFSARSRKGRKAAKNSEQYTDYGVNGHELAARDSLSTFSIDVDTGAYTIARRKLRDGLLPPPEAVRPEEFVNFFRYGYDAPFEGKPLAIDLEATRHPWDESRVVLRVGLQGQEIRDESRAPVHLTFLVDTSGSMSSSDKLGLAKRSLHHLVDRLSIEDTVAIATYAGGVRKVLPPTPTTRRATIHGAIDNLRSGGSTAMNSGIDLAYQMAKAMYLPGAENRVIVLSDGDANVGPATPEQIQATIAEHAGDGITLSTIGFGMGNYKDTMMEQLANKGDGNYFYVDTFAQAKRIFGTDLASTIHTIARDVKVQVAFDPDAVMAYRLLGYENRDIADEDFRNDAVDAGEVGSGHQVTALYEVVLNDDARGDFATVQLRAKPPGKNTKATEWSRALSVNDVTKRTTDSTPDLRLALGVAGFAELLRGSPYVGELSFDDVRQLVIGAGRDDADVVELLELIDRAEGLTPDTANVAGAW